MGRFALRPVCVVLDGQTHVRRYTDERTNEQGTGIKSSLTRRPCAYAPGRNGTSAASRKNTAASRLWQVAGAYSPFDRMSGTYHLPEPGVWLLVVDYWRCQRQDSQRKTSGKKPSEDGSISVGQFCASEKGHALRPERVNSIRPPTAPQNPGSEHVARM